MGEEVGILNAESCDHHIVGIGFAVAIGIFVEF